MLAGLVGAPLLSPTGQALHPEPQQHLFHVLPSPDPTVRGHPCGLGTQGSASHLIPALVLTRGHS
jgi:hypothetical protein